MGRDGKTHTCAWALTHTPMPLMRVAPLSQRWLWLHLININKKRDWWRCSLIYNCISKCSMGAGAGGGVGVVGREIGWYKKGKKVSLLRSIKAVDTCVVGILPQRLWLQSERYILTSFLCFTAAGLTSATHKTMKHWLTNTPLHIKLFVWADLNMQRTGCPELLSQWISLLG